MQTEAAKPKINFKKKVHKLMMVQHMADKPSSAARNDTESDINDSPVKEPEARTTNIEPPMGFIDEQTPTMSELSTPKIPKRMQSFLSKHPLKTFSDRSTMHRFKKMVFTFDR